MVQEGIVGEVLKFRLKENPVDHTDLPTTPAEIFIFSGVRIERRDFSLADRLYSSSKPAGKSCRPRQKSKE